MKNKWLAATHFERMHEVISAINTLSINAKLRLAGIPNPVDSNELTEARKLLTNFLQHFFKLVGVAEANTREVIIGDDPRIGDLLESFFVEKQRAGDAEGLYNISPEDLQVLIDAEETSKLERLVVCLRDLRLLIEAHSQTDISNLLGDI
jgi:hypothetical protein